MAATDIHKFARYDVKKDSQKLMFLARKDLMANIAKIKKKDQQSADKVKNESSDQDYDTTNTSASSCEVVAVAPGSSSKRNTFREAALERYKRKHCDVYEMEMDHFLTDTEKLITGKPQYRLIKSKDHEEVGLLQIVKVSKPPKQLQESDTAYHQMQALLYAGNSKYYAENSIKNKYSYCHYVQCNHEKNIFVVTEVKQNERWEEKVVSNVQKYFEYYDAIWAKAQKDCQDSSTQ